MTMPARLSERLSLLYLLVDILLMLPGDQEEKRRQHRLLLAGLQRASTVKHMWTPAAAATTAIDTTH